MALIENHAPVEDNWSRLLDDETADGRRDIIVPAVRLTEVARYWPAGKRGLGVRLEAGDAVAGLVAVLSRLDLIELVFGGPGDGRGFSQARLLRQRHGFAGTLRASGHIIPDQYAFLLQAGFDSFDVPDRFAATDWRRFAGGLGRTYQRGYARAGLAMRTPADAEPWREQPHCG